MINLLKMTCNQSQFKDSYNKNDVILYSTKITYFCSEKEN